MANDVTLLGDLGKPAAVLIEKVADAIGGLAKPWQIKRVAKAEAHAEVVRAEGRIAAAGLEQRAVLRLVAEEAKRQDNIEKITMGAALQLSDQSRPAEIEDDWISHFFERARLISDKDMQERWASVLAGQAECPGTFSRRTVDVLSTLDKADANLFASLKRFQISVNGVKTPAIYSFKDEIYKSHGVTWSLMNHLEDLGLVRLTQFSEKAIDGLASECVIHYYDKPIRISMRPDDKGRFKIGWIDLSRAGLDIFRIMENDFDQSVLEYFLEYWSTKRLGAGGASDGRNLSKRLVARQAC